MPSSTAVPRQTPPSIRSTVGHALTGALIGVVELVPGVSGGTVALVLGVFDRLISSANHLISGFVRLLLGRDRSAATRRLASVEWPLVLPLVVGMFLALFALSGPLHTFVDTQPVVASALFLGMVSASLLVPITMVREAGPATTASRIGGPVVVLGVAAAVFWLLGLPSVQIEDPAAWVIAVSGAAAVCALALPGLSGSFILLTFGMYEPTLEAVSTRDAGYLALFMAGAILGLVSVVQVLAYLLRVHRRPVLLAATGLILGSLRALWPWQDEGVLQPVGDDWMVPLLACLGGATLVILLWSKERRAARKSIAASPLTPSGDDRTEIDSDQDQDQDHQEGRR
jgi:putative membrane protein